MGRVIPFPQPRYLVQRREIDRTWRPVGRFGRPLIYATTHLAIAVAGPYGPGVRVFDTVDGATIWEA